MSASEVLSEIKRLPPGERTVLLEEVLRNLSCEERKPIERLICRLQHPDVPESFWAGIEDHEDGRTVDMEMALRETPPERQ
jgi:hypothetical protein